MVPQGFEQTTQVDYFETCSHVVKYLTIRFVFSLAVIFYWSIRQIDINNAFLNGDLKETIFMSQPKGYIDMLILNIFVSLIRCCKALSKLHKHSLTNLVRLCNTASTSDTSLFFSRKHSKIILVLVYVDEVFVTGEDPKLIQVFIDGLQS